MLVATTGAWASAGERTPLPVATTYLKVAREHAGIGDELMHEYLLGRASDAGQPRYLLDLLADPEAAWVVDVDVPQEPDVYGPASGKTLPLLAFVAYPATLPAAPRGYAFPYEHARYGSFTHMHEPGEPLRFADAARRYPLIVYAHGASAHGIYDVAHAQALASQGYIVAVPFYGDDRSDDGHSGYSHMAFLRPLLTVALIESLVHSDDFGPHIDETRIGLSGHSFGGFTALATAGAPYLANPATARHPNISAAVLAAPWVASREGDTVEHAFGPENRELQRVSTPVLSLFGTADEDTPAEFILPAMRQLGGPVYVVELVDQPHIFEPGSWQDRDRWERLFFAAYLDGDAAALRTLRESRSMPGGGRDRQLFEYQKVRASEPGTDAAGSAP